MSATEYRRVQIVTAYIFRHELITGEKPSIDDLVVIFEIPRDEISQIVEALALVESITGKTNETT